ncbi:MAG: 2-hydroxyacyl-CoA dehydratase family protein [Acetobacteraceae bacterium]|nr:2-hydroxyacyl-CoA dehydratase family protein [Acetobacteraceae bacterium]
MTKAVGADALGWTCAYVPQEIILAAGYLPRRVPLTPAGDAPSPLPANLCRPVREAAAQAAAGRLSGLAGVAVADACNPARALADLLNGIPGAPPLFWVPAPRSARGEAVRFYLRGLRRFAHDLGLDLRRPETEARLRRALAECDRVRRAYAELCRLRRARRAIDDGELQRALAGLEELPPAAAARELERLAADARRRPPHRDPNGAVRVLLVANFLPHPVPLLETVAALGGRVVHEDACHRGRLFLGLAGPAADPLEALARRYLRRPPCPRAEGVAARLGYLVRLARDFGARAMLYCLDPGCATQSYELAAAREALPAAGISLLAAEDGDRPGAATRTRLEAWLSLARHRDAQGKGAA